ncbi:DUF7619 domain-containing protein [Psychroserpens algicola]|uniref:T9SS type A sorting domain-containing protein n=1 Tax=Psychroserpens algicola TaxID=1719034 RepID=A0ABT0HAR8_9FLAO|nr:T9SS type A sorting domain-containing protein [Psychroserpens algicola]MCK8481468.1 T9SS type A sorting domain-containing protein [Psychroserpens algicola]
MKLKLLFPLFALLFSLFSFSQEITMQSGSWTECNFLLTDSGGSNANYESNENLTLTLCPQEDSNYVSINFMEFSTQLDADVLSIYDGDSVNSPLIGSYSGTSSPQYIAADNATGCLTLNFVSDSSGTTTGWLAEVICQVQDFSINQPSNFIVCDFDGDGFYDFDLTQKDAEILSGLNPSTYSVGYYLTQADADTQVNALSSPFTNFSNPQTIYVTVLENATGNIAQTSFDLIVDFIPQPTIESYYEICDGSSIIVDSGLYDPNYVHEWYLDGFIIPNENEPFLEVFEQGVYTLFVYNINGECSTVADFEVINLNFDGLATPSTLEICDTDSDGFATFDLSTSIPSILDGNDNPTLLVTFHETQSDANNNTNAIDYIYTNTTVFNQTLFVRVSSNSTDCFAITTLELVVNVNCVNATSVEVFVCGEDPNIPVEYDLTSQASNMIYGEDTSGYTFEYYTLLNDAQNEINPIVNPETYSVSGNSSVVYVRITDNQSGSFTIVEIFVNFYLSPQVVFNEPYTICDNGEIVLTPNVYGGSGQYTYLWNTGDTNPEIVVFEAGTYTVTVTDSNTDCNSTTTTVEVIEGTSVTIVQPQDLIACGPTNSVYDLTSVIPEVLNGIDPNTVSVTFYTNFNDLFNQTNIITNPSQYSAITNPQTIYIRVNNLSDSCFNYTSFNLIGESCPITVVCGEDPVNTSYCYELNDATQYTYSSSDGSPLQVFFNAGQVELGWDELYVLDSDGTTNLNPEATTYGNNGDLTGLSFISSGSSITIYVDSDDIIACSNQNFIPIDYDVSCVDPNALPNCTSVLTTPENGETNVNEHTDLIWTASSGVVNGYKLSVGITAGGTEIIDHLDVGNVLTYELETLDYEVTYYVTIIPYNDNGDAESCTEESFTTRPNPNQLIDCNSGAINTTHCYGNYDTTEFHFESSDGLPLTLVFNAGATEVNFDEVSIIDSDGTVLNSDLPYGNSGSFTGLTYTSVGSSISVIFDSDGSISCQSGSTCCTEQFDFDVFCASSVGFIQLNAFVDSNLNTLFDTNEVNFSNGYFTYEINNDGNINTVSSSTGSLQIISGNENDTYDITFNPYEESAGCYDVTIPVFNDISVATGTTVTIDFPVTEEQSCEDLAVYLINPWIAPRPGFTHENILVLENLGFTTIPSGTVEFTTDSQLIFNGVISVNPNYTVNTTASGFTVDFVNLSPGASEDIYISLTCPSTVALGDIVTNTATYITDSNDLVSINNYSTLSELVVGSWDPNDKMESHGPRIVYDDFVSSDEYLYYTIRFQNLGTAAATFIRIEDALDSQLDESTFQMIRSSHDYVVTRTDSDLEWYFEDINLPAEQDDAEGSQGYVYFRIKPKAGYAIGDIIPNTAAIYFDYNAPVITNRFDTEFVAESLSVSDTVFTTFDLYPNPAKDVVTIALNSNNSESVRLHIFDLQGKLILEENISEVNTYTIDVSDFQSGMYFVKLTTNTKTRVKKLVIE